MGQRLADDTIEAGDACTACEAVLWDAGETPLTVYVRFSQLQRCPGFDWSVEPLPPNNRVFTLQQHDVTPCRWTVTTTDGWTVNWYLNWGVDHVSKLYLDRAGLRSYFQSISDAENRCVGSFPNENVCNGLFLASGGFGWVEWKQIAIDLAAALNIELAPTLFYEVFQISIPTVVYKFTDKPRGVNIKVKLSWA